MFGLKKLIGRALCLDWGDRYILIGIIDKKMSGEIFPINDMSVKDSKTSDDPDDFSHLNHCCLLEINQAFSLHGEIDVGIEYLSPPAQMPPPGWEISNYMPCFFPLAWKTPDESKIGQG